MKFWAACILVIALVLRAAPICATPTAAEAASAMPDCDHSTTGDEKDQGKTDQDAMRNCPSCVFPPSASAVPAKPIQLAATMPRLQPATQLSGGALKPPVPPPRVANGTNIQQFNGVTS